MVAKASQNSMSFSKKGGLDPPGRRVSSSPASSLQTFSRVAANIVILLGLAILVGWAFDLPTLQSVFPGLVTMKANAALAFPLLAAGILAARPWKGLFALLASNGPGGVMARKLLPAAVAIPLIVGWLRLKGQRAGLYETEFGLALFASANIALFAALIWWAAWYLDETDAERGRAEETTRASEAKFRGLLESAPDAIVTSDREGRIALVNSQTEKMLGYSRDELVGQPVEMLLPEGLREKHVGHRTQYYADPRTRAMGAELSLSARRKDGSIVPVAIALSPLRIDGQLLITAVIRDITERNQQAHRLRTIYETHVATTSTLALSSILAVLLEKVDLYLPYATAGTVRLLNKETGRLELAACRNLSEEEWRAEKFIAGRPAMRVYESKSPITVRNIQTDAEITDPEFFRKHGLVSYLGIPLITKGELLGVLGIFTKEERDFSWEEIVLFSTIAGQASVAIQNARLLEEAKRQAAELEKTNRELAEASKGKDEFLSTMSHELRTPLNVVMGYAGLVKDGMLGEVSPEQANALENITRQSQYQLTMINSILQVTTLEAEKVKAHSSPLSLESFLDDLKSLYEVPLHRELSLTWDYPSGLPTIITDGDKLRQILQNLIDNAIKFTDKGRVVLTVRHIPEANSVEFKVADTGIGIPRDKLPIIFERFRQVDSSDTRLYGGVGLGLYIVKAFTELLGGEVAVESAPGKGSTFTVKIPVRR